MNGWINASRRSLSFLVGTWKSNNTSNPMEYTGRESSTEQNRTDRGTRLSLKDEPSLARSITLPGSKINESATSWIVSRVTQATKYLMTPQHGLDASSRILLSSAFHGLCRIVWCTPHLRLLFSSLYYVLRTYCVHPGQLASPTPD